MGSGQRYYNKEHEEKINKLLSEILAMKETIEYLEQKKWIQRLKVN